MRLELDAADGSLVEVALARAEDGEYYAIGDICSHGQVCLCEGEVESTTLECWLHCSVFAMHNGKPLSLPATQPVPAYPLTNDGENLLIDVDVPVAVAD